MLRRKFVFEMLEGMADHMRRVVQQLAGDMLLYCPAANEEEFQNAVAYLVMRLDENTAPENFLRQAFDLKTGTEAWEAQAKFSRRHALILPKFYTCRAALKIVFMKLPPNLKADYFKMNRIPTGRFLTIAYGPNTFWRNGKKESGKQSLW